MHEVKVSLENTRAQALIEAIVPATVRYSSVLVTDSLSTVVDSICPAILIPRSLTDIICAIHMADVAGILRAAHLNTATVEAVAVGCRVYSPFQATVLMMPDLHWEMVCLAATGYPQGAIADRIGYSSRQVRRILADYVPNIATSFEWHRLAPLLPRPVDPS